MARGKAREKGEVLTRQIQALELRKAGHTYRDIAHKLNTSLTQAHRDVNTELKRLADMRTDSAQELLQIELERIDKAVKGLMPFVESGSAAHAATLLKCIEQRAKLLGLYAPEKYTIQWQEQAVESIKAGDVDYEPLAEEFGIDLATQLFALAGKPISTIGAGETSDRPPAVNGRG